MEKQVIISISREYGSGGHDIAQLIADDFGLPLYDKNILTDIARERELPVEDLKKYDETPKKWFNSRRVGEHSNSLEDVVAQFQFDYLQEKAAAGESFVIVGRCAETVLKDCGRLVSVFVFAEPEFRVQRIVQDMPELLELPEEERLRRGREQMHRVDRIRKQYHNRYAGAPWGKHDLYDLSVNSSRLDIAGTARVIGMFIRERMEIWEKV